MKGINLRNYSIIIYKMIIYNLRIIFANKFIWFLVGSILFYIGLSIFYVFTNDVSKMEDMYGIFLFSGILLVFYPSVFGVQNDQDARTIEILFGIPNYRYKVWLVRILLIFIITFLIMFIFTLLSSFLIVKFRTADMTLQVMLPVIFLGVMAFMLSTVIRNGNGTAVVMIVFGLIFLILSGSLSKSQWNVFLNPFKIPRDLNEISWSIITFKNRIILITGTIVFLFAALYNLQKREKFM
jgi:ABC-type transport system involved in multi-copper enzyme maturation permease subunit